MPADERTFALTAREVAGLVAFWALFAVFRVADRVFTMSDLPASFRLLLPAAGESLGWLACTPLIVRLVEWCSATRRRVAIQIGLYASVGLLAAVAVSAVGISLRTSDLVRLVGSEPVHRLRPPYWFWVGDAFAVYLGVLGAAVARAYLLRYRSQREAATLLEARLAEARLDALRRQLDPHFLFNTLSLVASLVERDPPGARRMIARLSDLLRVSLADGDEPEIPLDQELTLVDRYVDIMRERFAERLTVEFDVDPGVRDALVPPLVLQPLVENAVKHGIEKARGPGRLVIHVGCEGSDLVLRVWGNGPDAGRGTVADGRGEAETALGHGVGLRNTRARLEQLYGRDASVALRAVDGGTEVHVRLPFHTRLHTPHTYPPRPAGDPGSARVG